ncbi:MAG: hypothetical protein ACREMX_00025 [Gemmatimonadales bacterium]
MSKWTRKFSVILLGVVLAMGVSCTASDNPVEPTAEPAIVPSQSLGDLVESLTKPVGDLRLLSCSTQPYAVTTRTIGPDGGVIAVGTHRLEIPRGALRQRVTIRAEQVPGRVNSVRLTPEGLRFAKPGALTLSYRNCSPLMLLKKVVYVDELLRILEVLESRDDWRNQTVTGAIKHFSRYAVAW